MRQLVWSIACAMAAFSAVPVIAATAYVEPAYFSTSRNYVVVEAAMSTEDALFPDRQLAAGEFSATSSTGEVTLLGKGVAFRDRTVLEVPLLQPGTWKIGTGDRAGRVSKWAKVDGAWRAVRSASSAPRGVQSGPPRPPADPATGPIDEAAIPAGAETMETVAYLKSEAYVTRGAPTAGALAPTGKGLELAPQTNPNEVFAGEAFKFRLLDEGKPVGGVEFQVSRGGDTYAERRFSHTGKTDASGAAAITLQQPGVYLLAVVYPGPAEAGAPPRSTTAYTLTFEVTR